MEETAEAVTHVYDEAKEKQVPASWGSYIEVSNETFFDFITIEKIKTDYGAEYVARAYLMTGNFGIPCDCVESEPQLSKDKAMQDLIEACEEQARERGEILYSDQGETE